jgi:hypothetical protein
MSRTGYQLQEKYFFWIKNKIISFVLVDFVVLNLQHTYQQLDRDLYKIQELLNDFHFVVQVKAKLRKNRIL